MEKQMKIQEIPQTDSIEELARFWDSHDLTDFEDQLEEITEPVFDRTGEATVNIRFQQEDFNAIREKASSKGVDYKTLIQNWVIEKLHSA